MMQLTNKYVNVISWVQGIHDMHINHDMHAIVIN